MSEYGIVANVAAVDRQLRTGSRAWLVGGTGGEGFHRFQWLARTRSGRMVTVWKPTQRFDNFRCAWIPDHIRAKHPYIYMEGTRPAMVERAAQIQAFRDELAADAD